MRYLKVLLIWIVLLIALTIVSFLFDGNWFWVRFIATWPWCYAAVHLTFRILKINP